MHLVTDCGNGIKEQRVIAIFSASPLSLKHSVKKVASCSLQFSQFQHSTLRFSPICLNRLQVASPSMPDTKINTWLYFLVMSAKLNFKSWKTLTFSSSSLCARYNAAKYSWKVLWKKWYSCWGLIFFALASLNTKPSLRAAKVFIVLSNSANSSSWNENRSFCKPLHANCPNASKLSLNCSSRALSSAAAFTLFLAQYLRKRQPTIMW